MSARGESPANPYAPPRSPLADVGEKKHGRPVMVWVITIFLGIGIVFGVVSTMAMLAGRPIGGAEAARATAHLTVFDHLLGLAMSALSAWWLVALFRLQRAALKLFLAVLGLAMASVLLNGLLRPEYRALFAGPALYSAAAGWVVNLAILAYVWRLHRRGVLRN